MYRPRRNDSPANRNSEEKMEPRTTSNVSLADVLDLSLQRDAEQSKIIVAPKVRRDVEVHRAYPEEADESEELPTDSVDDVKLGPAKVSKRKRWKKPKDKPKRPLSAYNLFFQHERERLLYGDDTLSEGAAKVDDGSKITEMDKKCEGRIGFAALAKEVASKWKLLEPHQKKSFMEEAEKEKQRYKVELDEWKTNQAKREQEAEEWAARRDDVVRSLSAVASEQDRTEQALQSAMSMQASFSATSSLSHLERAINDVFFNDLHSQQRNQYDQLLLSESLNQQRRLQQERVLSLSMANSESGLHNLNESPMDFYTRMIYAGTPDVVAAHAMNNYLSAQYAVVGRSLGYSGVSFPVSQGLRLNSVRNDALLPPSLHIPGRLDERLIPSLSVPFSTISGSRGRTNERIDEEESDEDPYLNGMPNQRERR